jgi:hypothetical protein
MKRFSLLLIVILFSCKSSFVKKNEYQNDNCKLISKDFGVDENTFKYFKNELSSFLKENRNLDILKIFYSGGNKKSHKLIRWSIDNDKKMTTLEIEGENSRTFTTSDYGLSEFEKKVFTIENKRIMQICPYDISSDTYVLLIKSKGIYKFKYISNSSNYSSLNNIEKKKILGVIDLINYLEKMNK